MNIFNQVAFRMTKTFEIGSYCIYTIKNIPRKVHFHGVLRQEILYEEIKKLFLGHDLPEVDSIYQLYRSIS